MKNQYQIILPKNAQRDLASIDSRYLNKIKTVLLSMGQDPFIGKKLKGELERIYSYRVGPYRILYEIKKRELIVLVIRIASRQGVY
jgi:mRNA interferase RelE/StbE